MASHTDADCGVLAGAIRAHYYGNIEIRQTGKQPPSPKQWLVEVNACNTGYRAYGATQWDALCQMRDYLADESGVPGPFVMPPLPSDELDARDIVIADLRGLLGEARSVVIGARGWLAPYARIYFDADTVYGQLGALLAKIDVTQGGAKQ